MGRREGVVVGPLHGLPLAAACNLFDRVVKKTHCKCMLFHLRGGIALAHIH